ncbi:hypothetical protein ABPG75_011901 [Micractinium tetrahymenae]
MGRWPLALQARESGGTRLALTVPRASAGVLVLEETHQPLLALPGGVLAHVEGPIHYLDLGSLQARSLADFGGSDELLAGVTKLYACHSGLRSLEGLQRFRALRWLYLDHNELGSAELLRIPELLPSDVRLESLDVRGNPGCTPEVEAALAASSLLEGAEFLNGQRLK